MRKKIANKTYWQRGGGDIVGFLCTLPCIIFMLVLLISIIQIGSIKERLEYTAYLACRKAVVTLKYSGLINLIRNNSSTRFRFTEGR